jgi:hypothetical protein
MKRNERKARHARALSLSLGLTLGGSSSTGSVSTLAIKDRAGALILDRAGATILTRV